MSLCTVLYPIFLLHVLYNLTQPHVPYVSDTSCPLSTAPVHYVAAVPYVSIRYAPLSYPLELMHMCRMPYLLCPAPCVIPLSL